jgi:hypothetical protein
LTPDSTELQARRNCRKYIKRRGGLTRRRKKKYQEILADRSSVMGVLPTPQLQFEKSIWKGKVLFKKEKGVGFEFKKPLDLGSFGKAYDFSFDTEKICQLDKYSRMRGGSPTR